jgi:hypothetical protein
MLILVADALHLPLLLPERGQVAQARYGVIALEILPFLQGFFCIQLLSSDIAFACVVRLFLYFLIQSEQVYDFVGGFVQPAAFER